MAAFLDIHTHRLDHPMAISNLRWPVREGVNHWFSVGIHPWDTPKNPDESEFKSILSHPMALAVGECGIDRLRGAALEQQLLQLSQQVQWAEELNKPMILHVVKGFQEVIALRKKLQPKQAWIIHGFNRNLPLAQLLVQEGFYLSFGFDLLSSRTLPQVIENIPLDRLFLETDDHPGDIAALYQTAGQILGKDPGELNALIAHNFEHVFQRKPSLA
jgi:TatD DNase family protein